MRALTKKRCQECEDALVGRIDKKFCSDQCRASYANRINRRRNKLIRNINSTLSKNRRILAALNTSGKTKVTLEKLINKGFDFDHFTSIYTTREGAVYKFCYDQGYLPVENNIFLLVVKKEP